MPKKETPEQKPSEPKPHYYGYAVETNMSIDPQVYSLVRCDGRLLVTCQYEGIEFRIRNHLLPGYCHKLEGVVIDFTRLVEEGIINEDTLLKLINK